MKGSKIRLEKTEEGPMAARHFSTLEGKGFQTRRTSLSQKSKQFSKTINSLCQFPNYRSNPEMLERKSKDMLEICNA